MSNKLSPETHQILVDYNTMLVDTLKSCYRAMNEYHESPHKYGDVATLASALDQILPPTNDIKRSVVYDVLPYSCYGFVFDALNKVCDNYCADIRQMVFKDVGVEPIIATPVTYKFAVWWFDVFGNEFEKNVINGDNIGNDVVKWCVRIDDSEPQPTDDVWIGKLGARNLLYFASLIKYLEERIDVYSLNGIILTMFYRESELRNSVESKEQHEQII